MNEEALRELVSGLATIDTEKMNAAMPLSGLLGGSLGRAKLDAALRAKLGISNPGVYTASTYGELCEMLAFSSPTDLSTGTIVQTGIANLSTLHSVENIRLGIDVESLSAFPIPADYWEDEFYSKTFTAREIAYAILQISPVASFAAMWCAKEALRKAYSAGTELGWQQIEVVHSEDGKPGLVVGEKPVAGALSLSHTDQMAFAAFVSAQLPQPEVSSSSIPQPPATPSPRKDRRAVVIAAIALLCSLLAIAITLYH